MAGWLEGVAGPLAGHALCEFCMGIPFAGPLRGYTTRVENFGWELCGEKGCGKSVLLQLMASTCGGARGGGEGNFAPSFASTAAGLEQEMQNYSDLVMLIDEASLFEMSQPPAARGQAFIQLLMGLGKGDEKRRMGAAVRAYRFVYATSSNEPMAQLIGHSGAVDVIAAVSGRLMTIPLAGRPQGIVDRMPHGIY